MDLMSYLIMPVQRIPRYVLLLRELLKYTPQDNKSRSTLVCPVDLLCAHDALGAKSL